MSLKKINTRTLKIISIVFILLVAAYFLIASIYVKQYLRNHADELTGRETSMESIYVNPITGYISIDNLRLNETDSDSIFIFTKNLSLRIPLSGLITKNYKIKNLKLESPFVSIIKYADNFNLSDLLVNKKKDNDTNKVVKISISNISIADGVFTFRDTLIPVYYKIKNVNLFSKGKKWDADTMSLKYSFDSGMISGSISGNFAINLKTSLYQNDVKAVNYDFNIIDQYLADLTKYGHLRAKFNAVISTSGNLNDSSDVTVKGKINITDLHFAKDSTEDIFAFEQISYTINKVSPKNHIYDFDTVVLIKPFLRYEIYDSLDIFQTIAKTGDEEGLGQVSPIDRFNLVVELARYIKRMSRNFFLSNYKINHVGIYEGNFRLNDYSLNEKFTVALSPITIKADSIHKTRDKINVTLKSEIQPYGTTEITASIVPKDSGTFTMDYSFRKIPISISNPYAAAYTSYSFDRGTTEIFGKWNVVKGDIKSKNHLIIKNVHVSENMKEKNGDKMPLPMLVSLIRDKDNVIDIEVPITGNLKHPNFHLGNVFMDVLKNIFVKPLSDIYVIEKKSEKEESDNLLSLSWPTGAVEMNSSQEKFTKKLADFLEDNPGATISVTPVQYLEKERENILFFEARKKYYTSKNRISIFTADDSIKVTKLSIRDPSFTKYLFSKVKDPLSFSVNDKCKNLIDHNVIESKYRALLLARKNNFLEYFNKNNTANRILFSETTNTIPYNGFSFYKIKYKGDFPEGVVKAYKKID